MQAYSPSSSGNSFVFLANFAILLPSQCLSPDVLTSIIYTIFSNLQVKKYYSLLHFFMILIQKGCIILLESIPMKGVAIVPTTAERIATTVEVMIALQKNGMALRTRVKIGRTWICGFIVCPKCGALEATVNEVGSKVLCQCGLNTTLGSVLHQLGVDVELAPEVRPLTSFSSSGREEPRSDSGRWGDRSGRSRRKPNRPLTLLG